MRHHHTFGKLVAKLYLIHLCFLVLTLLLLRNLAAALFVPLIYLCVLFWIGFTYTGRSAMPPLAILAAGYCSQLPSLICSLVIIGGKLADHNTLSVYDFTAQVWQTPFTPLFPFLPHLSFLNTPLYFWVILVLPLVLPMILAGGALLKTGLINRTARN